MHRSLFTQPKYAAHQCVQAVDDSYAIQSPVRPYADITDFDLEDIVRFVVGKLLRHLISVQNKLMAVQRNK